MKTAYELEDELRIARGAIADLERQVFALAQQRDVLQTCVDSYHRDMADPPGYLQDAVIRAAGLGAAAAELAALRGQNDLPPVEGDLLPAIGSRVLIHLSSADAWVPHTVVGYYVWGPMADAPGYRSMHRVFVRVRDDAGILNARMLKDVRPAPR